MKIIIYGGCHASVLKKMFDRYALGVESVDVITNFKLIQSGQPFPYEKVAKCDLIIFSPVLNKREYNTFELELFCMKHGVKFIKFPWLQWNGYWTGLTRRHWGNAKEWTFVPFSNFNETNFDEYYNFQFDTKSKSDIVIKSYEEALTNLKNLEIKSKVDIKISDFIESNFKFTRLFLTPDHPSTTLYKFVFSQLIASIGLRLDRCYNYIDSEMQEGYSLPIPPTFSEVFCTSFKSGDYINKEVLGDFLFTLRDYYYTHFFAHDGLLGVANNTTRLIALQNEKTINVRSGQKIVFAGLGNNVNGVYKSCAPFFDLRSMDYMLYPSHWVFKPLRTIVTSK